MYISKFFLTFFLCLSKKRFYIPIVNLCNVLKLQICPLVGHTLSKLCACVRLGKTFTTPGFITDQTTYTEENRQCRY